MDIFLFIILWIGSYFSPLAARKYVSTGRCCSQTQICLSPKLLFLQYHKFHQRKAVMEMYTAFFWKYRCSFSSLIARCKDVGCGASCPGTWKMKFKNRFLTKVTLRLVLQVPWASSQKQVWTYFLCPLPSILQFPPNDCTKRIWYLSQWTLQLLKKEEMVGLTRGS